MNRWPRWLQKSKPLTTQWDIEIQKTNNKQDLAHATTFQPSAKNNTYYAGVWLTAIGRHATAVTRHQNLDACLVGDSTEVATAFYSTKSTGWRQKPRHPLAAL